MVIQLPMYNEEAHAAAIIEACCRINYPRDRLLIQVRGCRGGWRRAAAVGTLV